jgi:predicted 3-demethylubiquinone-9 3-methyltransferase (glyoxalase superfamily)
MPKLTPSLWFDKQSEEAAQYYTSVFPNSRITEVLRHGEVGPGPVGDVLVVEFELDGQPFIAIDGGPEFNFSEAISFTIDCETQEEVDYYWSTLSSNGGEEGPCGWLKDRFGLSWQVVPTVLNDLIRDPDQAKAQRVMAAMLKMGKIEIEGLQAAADGAAVPAR